MDWPQQVKTRLIGLLPGVVASATFALLILGSAPAFAADVPNARELLRMVRASESGQNRDLTGKLRMSTDDGNLVIPFRLLMRGGTITYQFANPPEALILHLGNNGSRLERATGSGKTQSVAGAKLDAPVRGTDITYEDLALKFIYWNNARVVKSDDLGISHCWVVEAAPSGKDDSQYDRVRLWIEKSGGLLKAECYAGGRLLKTFRVRKVQHAHEGGGYILKSLIVQRPGKESPTYLEID